MNWELKILTAEADRLLALAAGDEQLRAELRALAVQILQATENDSKVRVESIEAQGPEPLRELTLGQARPTLTASQLPLGKTLDDDSLEGVESHCRLKAEGARDGAERLRRIGEAVDAPVAALDPETAGWIEALTDGYYWMNSRESPAPVDISALDSIGGCFEALAGAVALIEDRQSHHKGLIEAALRLLAEAQSSVRASLNAIGIADDPDQLQVFEWLKRKAAHEHVYIPHFMRANDPADPTRWPLLLDRIESFAARHGSPSGNALLPSLIETLGEHIKAVHEGRAIEADWQTVIAAVSRAVESGLAPSDRSVRERLLPVIDALPDRNELPLGFRRVLQEIDRYVASRMTEPVATEHDEPSAEVSAARRLLEGRCAVLIGGACRRESQRLLKAALGLKDLHWIETKEHQSIISFEHAIARESVAVVLLAIRWSSHSFGEVSRFCEQYHKPLVRLPGGYGPNQVAAQIIAQCSERLARRSDST